MENLEELYIRIISGTTPVEYRGSLFFVKDPTVKEKQLGQLHYQKCLDRFIKDRIWTKEEISFILAERDLWNPNKEEQLSLLRDEKRNLQDKLPALEFKSVEKARIKRQIEKIESQMTRMIKSKNALFNHSAEHLANIEKYKFFIFLCTFNENEERVWPTWISFQTAQDDLVSFLMKECFLNEDINEKKIRKLARSEPWRSTWLASNKSGNLFSFSMTEMTDLQRSLVGWSMIYDNAYESPDCPGDEVIDDDILFDAWLEEQSRKRKRESQKNSFDKMKHGSGMSGEVGIMVDSVEDAKRVYNLNDSGQLRKIENRDKRISDKGSVKEQVLPDITTELKMLREQKATEGIKRR